MPEVADSLVVHLEDDEGGAGQLLLFVVLAEGLELDETLQRRIAPRCVRSCRRATCPTRSARSPRLPRTLSGKKLEVPVKRILQGASIEDAAAKGALANPDSLDAFIGIRESL